MSLIAKDDWHGPLKVTYLKAKLRLFAADIQAADDVDSLNISVNQYRSEMNQAQHDLPDWFEAGQGAILDKLGQLYARTEEEESYGTNFKG